MESAHVRARRQHHPVDAVELQAPLLPAVHPRVLRTPPVTGSGCGGGIRRRVHQASLRPAPAHHAARIPHAGPAPRSRRVAKPFGDRRAPAAVRAIDHSVHGQHAEWSKGSSDGLRTAFTPLEHRVDTHTQMPRREPLAAVRHTADPRGSARFDVTYPCSSPERHFKRVSRGHRPVDHNCRQPEEA